MQSSNWKSKQKAVFNWSGGKDSALALYHLLQNDQFEITQLLTTVNSAYERVSMHGVRKTLLLQQAQSLGLPVSEIVLPESMSMEEYDAKMNEVMQQVKSTGVVYSAYGDIFLEDLKKYREDKLAEVDMKGLFPIWKRDTAELLTEFIDLGFKTILVCVQSDKLDESFAGRIIDRDFISDLPEGVDACGENGEFHTFVYDGPIFKNPIKFELGETVYREYEAPKDCDDSCMESDCVQKMAGYYFKDLIPAPTE